MVKRRLAKEEGRFFQRKETTMLKLVREKWPGGGPIQNRVTLSARKHVRTSRWRDHKIHHKKFCESQKTYSLYAKDWGGIGKNS